MRVKLCSCTRRGRRKAVRLSENHDISASFARLGISLVAEKRVRVFNSYRAYADLICQYPLRRELRVIRKDPRDNIVADVLVMMMPLFRDVMAQGGEIILSGIIAPRKQKVLDALKDGFDVIEVREENDWVAVLAKVR